MIGRIITGKLLSVAVVGILIGSFALYGLAYWSGYGAGKKAQKAEFAAAAEKAAARAEEAEKAFNAGKNILPDIINQQNDAMRGADSQALRRVAMLEGQIQSLKWELKNVKTDDYCAGPLPDAWRLQHNRLDNILQGVSETGRAGGLNGNP